MIIPAVTGLNILGITMPNFILGISLIFCLCGDAGLAALNRLGALVGGCHRAPTHMIMPVLTLSAYYFGAFSLVFRAEQRDVYRKLYIHVARSKGLSEWKVAFKHALPNAVLPVITFMGLAMGQLTGGAVVTETVFSMPGVGRLFVSRSPLAIFPSCWRSA